jgi:hypothetical protein
MPILIVLSVTPGSSARLAADDHNGTAANNPTAATRIAQRTCLLNIMPPPTSRLSEIIIDYSK